jgi:hypothetical protein
LFKTICISVAWPAVSTAMRVTTVTISISIFIAQSRFQAPTSKASSRFPPCTWTFVITFVRDISV